MYWYTVVPALHETYAVLRVLGTPINIAKFTLQRLYPAVPMLHIATMLRIAAFMVKERESLES
jgi:hypothetical protein